MVAMDVWPTEAGPGIVATEARWRKMGRIWASSGVSTAGALAPSRSGTSLTIQPGAVWIDGHYAELLAAQTLTITSSGICVARWDPATQSVELLWRDAVLTPTVDPTGIYEFVIYQLQASGVGRDLRTFMPGLWVPYTPELRGNSGPIGVIGNGQISGRWTRQGTLITAQARFTAGSTSVLPTGNLRLSLPTFGANTVNVPNGPAVVKTAAGIFAGWAAIEHNTSSMLFAGPNSLTNPVAIYYDASHFDPATALLGTTVTYEQGFGVGFP
jgi:hypothetical protein